MHNEQAEIIKARWAELRRMKRMRVVPVTSDASPPKGSMNTVSLQESSIAGIDTRFPGGGLITFLRVTTPWSQDIAELLGAAYLTGSSREQAVLFAYSLRDVWMDFTPAGIESKRIRLECRTADRFRAVLRTTKAGTKRTLSFRLRLELGLEKLIDYLLHIGGSEGTMVLTPQQGDLFSFTEGKE